MLRQQLLNLFHFVWPDAAALNETGCFAHAPQADRSGNRSPAKNETIFSFPPIVACRHKLSSPFTTVKSQMRTAQPSGCTNIQSGWAEDLTARRSPSSWELLRS